MILGNFYEIFCYVICLLRTSIISVISIAKRYICGVKNPSGLSCALGQKMGCVKCDFSHLKFCVIGIIRGIIGNYELLGNNDEHSNESLGKGLR